MSSDAPKDVMKLLSGSLVAKVFTVASMMVFTRILTKNQMAIFPAYVMLAGLVGLFLTFGIFAAFVREVPSLVRTDRAQARSLVVTGSAIVLAGTLIPCVACWFWSGWVAQFVFKDTAQAWAVRIMAPGFLAVAMSRIADWVMWGCGQYGPTSIVKTLESLLRPVCTLACFYWLGYRGIVVGLVGAQFVLAAIGFWYVRDMFIGPMSGIYPLRKLIAESMTYYIGDYLSYLRGDGDSLLVTTFLGPSALAEYYIAKTLFTNMQLVWTAVDRVAAERLARFVHTPEFGEKLKALHIRISQVTIPLSTAAIAVAPSTLVLLAGARYADAGWPAAVLLLSALVLFVAIPYDRGVYIALPGTVRLKFTAIEAVVVLASAAILVPLAGLVGVALARIVAPTGVCVFGAYILWRHMGLALPLRPVLLALATTAPGAILALVLTPAAHGIGSALTETIMAATVWASTSAMLAYLFNRPLLDLLIRNLSMRYRTFVSA